VHLYEKEMAVEAPPTGTSLLCYLAQVSGSHLASGEAAMRVVVSESSRLGLRCELGVAAPAADAKPPALPSVFGLVRRSHESTDRFNVALVVPTGIGAEIGGHAGDATPVARLIGEVCDVLITHPNVVNASDLNEMPSNTLYVEGSVLSRFLMGTIGLQPVRSNRVLLVIDDNPHDMLVSAAINAASAARASFGLHCSGVVTLDPRLTMLSRYSDSGRAVGEVSNLEGLFDVLASKRSEYDAVAISSTIKVPLGYHQRYFESAGSMVNPWGGVEAMLTHAVSSLFNVPSAHSPMLESPQIANMDSGVVEPRLAAEAISFTYLQCVLKGLQRSPRIITDPEVVHRPGILTAADVSCLVIPDGCLGLPTLAALEQGIPVIAVRENKNLMKNDLRLLPWRPGQFYRVENYWEAVGVLASLRAGLDPATVRRPLAATKLTSNRDSSEELIIASDGATSD
jgi:hypothetical protein